MRRRLQALAVAGLGLAAAVGCQDLNYNCVGVCGDMGQGGYYAGVIGAPSQVDAVDSCFARLACDGGYTANCNCYLSEEAARGQGPNPTQ